MAEPPSSILQETNIHVSLTHQPLDPLITLSHVRSPSAGAIVLFAGTTRDTFDARAVADLTYQSYTPRALQTLRAIATTLKAKHGLTAIAIVHRLGTVPVGEESILIAVSSPHRGEAWRAGEECLEEVKARAEIWKLERFVDDKEGVWRANRDGAVGVRVANGDGDGDEDGAGKRPDGEDHGQEEVEKNIEVQKQQVSGTMGPVIRPQRPGEKGHGPVVNPKHEAPSSTG